MIQAGDILEDKYEIIKEIGRGGMAAVYLAKDVRLNKLWAVKEIERDNIDILRKEADVIKKLDHQMLPRIVDIIFDEDYACIVMDYIEGRTLSEVLRAEGAIREEIVVGWAKSICEVLRYLHNLKPPVIYLDLKPSNIMLKPDGTIKLIDFGATLVGVYDNEQRKSFGTKGYAAPEQLLCETDKGTVVDHRADIYGLGATMYALLTGELFERDRCEKIVYLEDKNFQLSESLMKVIMECLEVDPDKRYQSTDELLFHLQNYKKYDRSYRIKCRKKMLGFITSIILSICFVTISFCGYKGIVSQQNDRQEIGKNDDVLMSLGMDYFLDLKDYEKSAYYFGLVDDNKYPEAGVYKNISMSMYNFNVDAVVLSSELKTLINRTRIMPSAENKIKNYEMICNIYSINNQVINDADKQMIITAEEGLKLLDEHGVSDEQLNYYISFNQYIISGCESLGSDRYEKALNCCNAILEIVSKNDDVVVEGIKISGYRKIILCKKAELLAGLKRYEEAIDVYEKAEDEYSDDAAEFFIGHISLLCDIEESKTSDVEKWNGMDILTVYDRAKDIAGIDNDYRFKRLKVKLEPLLIKEE